LDHEVAEPLIAQAARGFFDRFGGLPGEFRCFGGGVDAVLVERQFQARSERADKFEIGIGFGPAKAVVQMGDVQDEAKFSGAGVKHEQERHGVCPAGDANREAQAGREGGRVERESGLAGHYQNDRRNGLESLAWTLFSW
jgi:hypothetical protein